MTDPIIVEVTIPAPALVEVRASETLLVEIATPVAPVEIAIPAAPLLVETIVPAPPLQVELGIPGPPGISGDDALPYAKRTDFVGDSLIYKGQAIPGSSETAEVWRISRIVLAGEDVIEEWASGSAEFTHAWSERSSYTYS